MKKYYITVLMFAIMVVPGVSQAASIDDLEKEIQALKEEMFELRSMISKINIKLTYVPELQVLTDLEKSTPSIAMVPVPVKSDKQVRTLLQQGSQGEEVRYLQEMLASDPSIYPEGLVTGYYGGLTGQAVERFRAAFDFPAGNAVDFDLRGQINKVVVLYRGDLPRAIDEHREKKMQEALQSITKDSDAVDEEEHDHRLHDHDDEELDEEQDDARRDDDIEDLEETRSTDVRITAEIRGDKSLVRSMLEDYEETFFLGVTDEDRIIEEVSDRFDMSEAAIEEVFELLK